MDSLSQDGFTQRWPTLFLEREIPRCETANGHLERLILEREREDGSLTTNYSSYDLLEFTHPVIDWLRQCMNKSVADYLRKLGVEYDIQWRLHAWANVNRTGDYHNLHNHPHSYLSGTYYVKVPGQVPARHGRSDLDPGAISFFDPRPQANMRAIRGDGEVNPEYRVQPRAGLILLWPSFIHHLVHPNLSDELRISISFNVMPKWSDELLPPQSG